MKIQFKGKMRAIERASNDAVVVRFTSKDGKVIEGGEKLAPSAKEAEMSLEFVLRPAIMDEIPIGKSIVVTIATATEDE